MNGRVLLVSALVAGAFAAGWGAHARVRSNDLTEKSARPEAQVSLPEGFWVEMEAQRAMMRQLQETCERKAQAAPPVALAAANPPAADPQRPASAPEGAAAASANANAPEDPTAMPASQAILDRAMANGKWTDDDAAAFRVVLSEMSSTQRDKAMHNLLRALNEQGLRSVTHGPSY